MPINVNKRPNVLVFAPAFAPFFFSESLVNSKLALAMQAENWDVTVISAASSDASGYSSAWGEPWESLRSRVHILHPEPKVGSLLGRVISRIRNILRLRHPISGAIWSERAADLAIRLHKERPFTLVLTRSTSCYAHLPGLLFRRSHHIPWIANWNDPPGHLFPPPYSYPLPLLQRFFKNRYMRSASQAADMNTFPSEQLMDFMTVPLGLVDSPKKAVIPHVGLGWEGAASAKDPLRFRICHAGNLSAERDPRSFLKALAKLRDMNPSIKVELEIIGVMPESIMTEVIQLNLEDQVIFTPGMSFVKCLERMQHADVLLMIEAEVKNGIFFPSKIIDYVEVGRPILAISPKKGVIKDLFSSNNYGAFAEVGSSTSIEKALDTIFNDWRSNCVSPQGISLLRNKVKPATIVKKLTALSELIEKRNSTS